ncbi:MAG: 4-hydroxythreonine-4-phosphate dehydrogenase PdxA [Synechococcaceae cyanobacterium ELA445]
MNAPSITSNSNAIRIAIAAGDPAGIGTEVVLKALHRLRNQGLHPLLVGCRRQIELCYHEQGPLSPEPLADPGGLEILDLPLEGPSTPGLATASGADASFRWLTAAAEQVLAGNCDALVTAPISKQGWQEAGHTYPGQTERLADLCGMAKASMLFTALAPHGRWRLNTLLATTHLPLAEVPTALTPAGVEEKLEVLLRFARCFNPAPRLVVAGLNPHAGEGGHLGKEEVDWLIPLLERWRARHPDVEVVGPLPPDTCWLEAGRAWQGSTQGPDGYLALYHDQGLIPVKLLAFDAAVNTTLGLPFLRTSPDHGTGFDIAGLGIARADSMQAALEAARDLRAV